MVFIILYLCFILTSIITYKVSRVSLLYFRCVSQVVVDHRVCLGERGLNIFLLNFHLMPAINLCSRLGDTCVCMIFGIGNKTFHFVTVVGEKVFSYKGNIEKRYIERGRRQSEHRLIQPSIRNYQRSVPPEVHQNRIRERISDQPVKDSGVVEDALEIGLVSRLYTFLILRWRSCKNKELGVFVPKKFFCFSGATTLSITINKARHSAQ
jgi:hypothetical protein